MSEKNSNEIDIKKKEDDKSKNKRVPPAWNPIDLVDTLEQRFRGDPWRTPWDDRNSRSSLPGRRLRQRLQRSGWKSTAIDLIDNGKEFEIIAEMPGVDKEDLEVSLTDRDISIRGELKTEEEQEEEGYIKRERVYSNLCRNMRFPEEVNPDKAEATLKKGVLEVKIAKKNPSSGRKNIPVE